MKHSCFSCFFYAWPLCMMSGGPAATVKMAEQEERGLVSWWHHWAGGDSLHLTWKYIFLIVAIRMNVCLSLEFLCWNLVPKVITLEGGVIVTRLNESVCLCTSKPNKTHTGVCNQEKKDLWTEEMGPCSVTKELMLKDLVLQWLPGDGLYREKIMNHND